MVEPYSKIEGAEFWGTAQHGIKDKNFMNRWNIYLYIISSTPSVAESHWQFFNKIFSFFFFFFWWHLICRAYTYINYLHIYYCHDNYEHTKCIQISQCVSGHFPMWFNIHNFKKYSKISYVFREIECNLSSSMKCVDVLVNPIYISNSIIKLNKLQWLLYTNVLYMMVGSLVLVGYRRRREFRTCSGFEAVRVWIGG